MSPIHSPPKKSPMSAKEPVVVVGTEESSDCGNDSAGDVLKKSVRKSVNSVAAPVMGGAAWPTVVLLLSALVVRQNYSPFL